VPWQQSLRRSLRARTVGRRIPLYHHLKLALLLWLQWPPEYVSAPLPRVPLPPPPPLLGTGCITPGLRTPSGGWWKLAMLLGRQNHVSRHNVESPRGEWSLLCAAVGLLLLLSLQGFVKVYCKVLRPLFPPVPAQSGPIPPSHLPACGERSPGARAMLVLLSHGHCEHCDRSHGPQRSLVRAALASCPSLHPLPLPFPWCRLRGRRPTGRSFVLLLLPSGTSHSTVQSAPFFYPPRPHSLLNGTSLLFHHLALFKGTRNLLGLCIMCSPAVTSTVQQGIEAIRHSSTGEALERHPLPAHGRIPRPPLPLPLLGTWVQAPQAANRTPARPPDAAPMPLRPGPASASLSADATGWVHVPLAPGTTDPR